MTTEGSMRRRLGLTSAVAAARRWTRPFPVRRKLLSAAALGATSRPRLAGLFALLSGAVLVLGVTLPASAATGSPPPAQAAGDQTIVIHGRGANARDFFDCKLTTGIAKSKKYPGFIVGTAHFKSCVGSPYPSECSATADMEIDIPKHGWLNDGDGRTVHGCPPAAPTSSIKKKCKHTSAVFNYRTVGIYVVIWEGRTFDTSGVSPTLGVVRIC